MQLSNLICCSRAAASLESCKSRLYWHHGAGVSKPADVDGVACVAHAVQLWVCDRQQAVSGFDTSSRSQCNGLTGFDLEGICMSGPAVLAANAGTPYHDLAAQGGQDYCTELVRVDHGLLDTSTGHTTVSSTKCCIVVVCLSQT